MAKKRLTFRCWHCGKDYKMTRELDGKSTVIVVACPYCEKEAVAELGDPQKITVVHKGLEDATVEGYDFPDPLPTSPRLGEEP